jgi:hypothetical protein
MNKKTALTLTAIVVAAALAIGAWWIFLRPKAAAPRAKPKASASVSAPTAPNADQIAALTDLATRFEHASRDWGVDPNAMTDVDANKLKDGAAVVSQYRTPTTLDNGPLDAVSSIDRKGVGWDAPSPVCADTTLEPCHAMPTMLSYWANQHWSMGARLSSVDAQVRDARTVEVKGTVRVGLWTMPDADVTRVYGPHAAWGFSPAAGDQTFDDVLTVSDGKVTKREASAATDWIADPYYGSWAKSDNPADGTMSWGNRVQPNIPLLGDPPSLGLDRRDPGMDMLKSSNDASSPDWKRIIDEASHDLPNHP